MVGQSLMKSIRPALRSSIQARTAFSTTARAMAEGDTGAPRAGQGDAFSKREKANEDYGIKMREREKLLELKQKIREQHEHLEKLEKHIDELHKSSPEDERK